MPRDERAEPRELEDLGGAPALDAAARLDAPHEADREVPAPSRRREWPCLEVQLAFTPSPTLYAESFQITHKPKN